MLPGFYWAAIFIAISGGSGTPNFMNMAMGNAGPGQIGCSIMGGNAANAIYSYATATATANPAPDPATLTSYFAYASNGGSPYGPFFMLGT